MTPSSTAPEVYDISDISYSHMVDQEEDIQIYDIEEKFSFHSIQTFSSDSLLNFVQNLPVIASESEEEFDFSPSNVVVGVLISNNLDILEKISYGKSDPFALIYLELPTNSYRIAFTNTHNFEGEKCASTISMDHTFGSDMNLFGCYMILFGYYMILFGFNFKFQ